MRYLAIGLVLILSGTLNGCSILPEKGVYVAPGQIAELSKDVRVSVWVRNKETSKMELRKLTAKAGWFIGRPKPESIVISEVK